MLSHSWLCWHLGPTLVSHGLLWQWPQTRWLEATPIYSSALLLGNRRSSSSVPSEVNSSIRWHHSAYIIVLRFLSSQGHFINSHHCKRRKGTGPETNITLCVDSTHMKIKNLIRRCGGGHSAWVAQSVKCLTQVVVSGSWDWAPHRAPCLAGSLLEILSFCPYPTQKNN